MALPLPLKRVVNIFGQQITIYDETITLGNDGRGSTVTSADRIIFGTIQPANYKQINITHKGALSEGDMLLSTDAIIYAYDSTQTTEQNMQTFVRYVGDIWKVIQLGEWADKNQGINHYGMTRYQDLGY